MNTSGSERQRVTVLNTGQTVNTGAFNACGGTAASFSYLREENKNHWSRDYRIC